MGGKGGPWICYCFSNNIFVKCSLIICWKKLLTSWTSRYKRLVAQWKIQSPWQAGKWPNRTLVKMRAFSSKSRFQPTWFSWLTNIGLSYIYERPIMWNHSCERNYSGGKRYNWIFSVTKLFSWFASTQQLLRNSSCAGISTRAKQLKE